MGRRGLSLFSFFLLFSIPLAIPFELNASPEIETVELKRQWRLPDDLNTEELCSLFSDIESKTPLPSNCSPFLLTEWGEDLFTDFMIKFDLDEKDSLFDDSSGFFFGEINQVISDQNGDIYVLDDKEVQVYRFSQEGKLLALLGRKGEGPGEYYLPINIFRSPENLISIVQSRSEKLRQFNSIGEPLGNLPWPSGHKTGGMVQGYMKIKPLSAERFFAVEQSMDFYERGIRIPYRLQEITSDTTRTLHEEVLEMDFSDLKYEENKWDTFQTRWDTNGHHLFYSDDDEFHIQVIDLQSGKRSSIKIDTYPKCKRSKEDLETILPLVASRLGRLANRNIDPKYVVPRTHHRTIQNLYLLSDGNLWVHTSQGFDDWRPGFLGTFEVLSIPEGKHLRKVEFYDEGIMDREQEDLHPAFNRFYFIQDRIYVANGGYEDEGPGEPALNAYRFEGLIEN